MRRHFGMLGYPRCSSLTHRGFASAAQRLQLSRFGPRYGCVGKRIRRWAEVGSSAELGDSEFG